MTGGTRHVQTILKTAVVFILAVAVYDIFVTVRFSDEIYDLERNAVAKWLIGRVPAVHVCDRCGVGIIRTPFVVYDVSLLVAVKVVGVLMADRILRQVIEKTTAFAVAVVGSVFFVQLWLLLTLIL
jgi:hypothetical protein